MADNTDAADAAVEAVWNEKKLEMECRRCGNPGFACDIRDDPDDNEFGLCGECDTRDCPRCGVPNSVLNGDDNECCDDCQDAGAATVEEDAQLSA